MKITAQQMIKALDREHFATLGCCDMIEDGIDFVFERVTFEAIHFRVKNLGEKLECQ